MSKKEKQLRYFKRRTCNNNTIILPQLAYSPFPWWNAAKSAPLGWCCHCGATPTYIWTETGELLFRSSPIVALHVLCDLRRVINVLRHHRDEARWGLCAFVFVALAFTAPEWQKLKMTRVEFCFVFLTPLCQEGRCFLTLSMSARGMFHGWIASLREAQRGPCLRPVLHLIVSFSPTLPPIPPLLSTRGFSVTTAGRSHVFKPVSVQAMWWVNSTPLWTHWCLVTFCPCWLLAIGYLEHFKHWITSLLLLGQCHKYTVYAML